MGPNTNDRELMKKLMLNGMDVARFNFSHGDHEEQKSRMDLLKQLREELHTNSAITNCRKAHAERPMPNCRNATSSQ